MKRIWMTSRFNGKGIEPVNCTKSTEKSVWVEETCLNIGGPNRLRVRRCLRSGEYEQYHDTWDEAHDYLMTAADQRLRKAGEAHDSAMAHSRKVKALQKPEGA